MIENTETLMINFFPFYFVSNLFFKPIILLLFSFSNSLICAEATLLKVAFIDSGLKKV